MEDEVKSQERVDVFTSMYKIEFNCVERYYQLTRLIEIMPAIISQKFNARRKEKE